MYALGDRISEKSGFNQPFWFQILVLCGVTASAAMFNTKFQTIVETWLYLAQCMQAASILAPLFRSLTDVFASLLHPVRSDMPTETMGSAAMLDENRGVDCRLAANQSSIPILKEMGKDSKKTNQICARSAHSGHTSWSTCFSFLFPAKRTI